MPCLALLPNADSCTCHGHPLLTVAARRLAAAMYLYARCTRLRRFALVNREIADEMRNETTLQGLYHTRRVTFPFRLAAVRPCKQGLQACMQMFTGPNPLAAGYTLHMGCWAPGSGP